MKFDHMLFAFSTDAPILLKEELLNQDCFFAPIARRKIMTVDSMLWDFLRKSYNSHDYFNDFQNPFDYINERTNDKFVIGLVDMQQHEELHPGNVFQPPVYIDSMFDLLNQYNFRDFGFDIMGWASMAGALFNMGYSEENAQKIYAKGFKVNEFSLLDEFEDAVSFCELADDLALGHAPFFPVKVFSNFE